MEGNKTILEETSQGIQQRSFHPKFAGSVQSSEACSSLITWLIIPNYHELTPLAPRFGGGWWCGVVWLSSGWLAGPAGFCPHTALTGWPLSAELIASHQVPLALGPPPPYPALSPYPKDIFEREGKGEFQWHLFVLHKGLGLEHLSLSACKVLAIQPAPPQHKTLEASQLRVVWKRVLNG